MLENRPDCIHFGAAGHVLGTAHRAAGRVHRVRAQPAAPGVADPAPRAGDRQCRPRHAGVAEPSYDAARQRVTGVLLDAGEAVAGRSRRRRRRPRHPAAGVAGAVGIRPAREDTVDVGIAYATHQVRIPDGLLAEKVVVAGASHEHPRRPRHALLRGRHLEPDDLRHRQGRAAADFAGSATWPTRCCRSTSPPRCGRATRSARWRSTSTRPAGGAATTSCDRFPAGIFPFGDAVVSFNPTFGQGMTMTAIQAGHLRRALESGRRSRSGFTKRRPRRRTRCGR